MTISVQISPVILEICFETFIDCFNSVLIISPLKRIWPLMIIWTNLKFLLARMFCTNVVWIGIVNWEKMFGHQTLYLLFPYYFSIEERLFLYLINKLKATPFAKFCWNWCSGAGEEYFQNTQHPFLIILTLKRNKFLN